ncbi:HK97 family phage prohead protease [Paucibacter sp. O1-1]|nr:HK97 family phage prohead protease [Paucibacter sp. O1-1]MDA3825224.1 HK97 family phage prohead protease [Paucibacter sp. O1-1]
MLLHKHLPLSDVKLKAEGPAGTFSGYSSVFGGVDSVGDTIVRGAFASTLRQNGMPKMFFNHDWRSIPVGKWTKAVEDEHGLYVEGEFTPGLVAADAVYAAMKHGTLGGLSVGGFVKQGDYDATEQGRVIRKWSRLVEISPVVFPADGAARVQEVKGADMLDALAEVATIRELEQLLRDAAGLSKGAASALVARVKALALQGEPAAVKADDEAAQIQQLAARLQRLALA